MYHTGFDGYFFLTVTEEHPHHRKASFGSVKMELVRPLEPVEGGSSWQDRLVSLVTLGKAGRLEGSPGVFR